MNIREIINKEKWDKGFFAFTHNESLDKILSAVLEDEAALMKQVKLWSTACKEAEQRIAELIEVLGDIVLGTPIDDCNRNDDGLNAHPRNMERRIERAKSILKKEGGKW